jgi:hypothetical protein
VKRFITAVLLLLSAATLAFAQDATPAPEDIPGLATTVPPTLVAPAQGTPIPASASATPESSPTPIPRPMPVTVVEEDGVTLELFFSEIAQGQVGLMRVYGEGIGGARARFMDEEAIDCYAAADGYYCLLAVNMEQRPRAYDLMVYAWQGDDPARGQRTTLSASVEVTQGRFIRQEVTVPPERTYLIEPDVERNEFARLESLLATEIAAPLWVDQPFMLPVPSEPTSPFGAYRIFNGGFPTRHTGWDLRATVGTPVMTMATGRVAFAGLLDIRGNYVLIDHGGGLFSGAAHLSQIHVTRGQSVTMGQIIGVSGDTGRSNGPHLHWEIAVHGVWVDSVAFMGLWLPEPLAQNTGG